MRILILYKCKVNYSITIVATCSISKIQIVSPPTEFLPGLKFNLLIAASRTLVRLQSLCTDCRNLELGTAENSNEDILFLIVYRFTLHTCSMSRLGCMLECAAIPPLVRTASSLSLSAQLVGLIKLKSTVLAVYWSHLEMLLIYVPS